MQNPGIRGVWGRAAEAPPMLMRSFLLVSVAVAAAGCGRTPILGTEPPDPVVIDGPSAIGEGVCGGPYVASARDDDGLPRRLPLDVDIAPSGHPAALYLDEHCTRLVDSARLPAGSAQPATFFLRADSAGPVELVARTREGERRGSMRVSIRRVPSQVTLGSGDGCALVDGEAWCWGVNTAGQLGTGDRDTRRAPAKVRGLPPPVTRIETSRESVHYDEGHTCAVAGGRLFCWGRNDAGQLGQGTGGGLESATLSDDSAVPVEVTGWTGTLEHLALGTRHACVGSTDGVWCWGFDHAGPLRRTPERIEGLGRVQSLSAGGFQTCAVTPEGDVLCWGWNIASASRHAQPVLVEGIESDARHVAVGTTHACAVVNNGVRCWGDNRFGQLGDGTRAARLSAVPVADLGAVTRLTAGAGFTCAVRTGALWCWGANDSGQLGDDSGGSRSVPGMVPGLDRQVAEVTAGDNAACALVQGAVRCWGRDGGGQLGRGDDPMGLTPLPVVGLEQGVTAVTTGWSHACALQNGRVKCWGGGTDQQLGGGTGLTATAVPVEVPGLTDAVAITAAGRATCALTGSGEVRCWGRNLSGELGRDPADVPNSAAALTVPGLDEGVTALAAAAHQVCAVKDGGLWCWGMALEEGSPQSTAPWGPRLVPGLEQGVTAAGGTFATMCAVKHGELWCFGRGEGGQLGLGRAHGGVYDGWSPPVRASAVEGPVEQVGGAMHFGCALVQGAVRCWGRNHHGALGDGTAEDRFHPVTPVGLDEGVTRVSASVGTRWVAGHACAVKDGGLWCWGYNGSGQLGTGTLQNASVPTPVAGLDSGVTDVATGARHTCAVADGGAWCWGADSELGLLGRGELPGPLAPAPIADWSEH